MSDHAPETMDLPDLRHELDEWARSTEFTRTTTRPVDAGDQIALRDAADLLDRFDAATRAQEAELSALREARDRLAGELHQLEMLVARRPAMDQRTLYDNVAKAIRVAGEKTDECVRLERRAEKAEAALEASDLKGQRLRGIVERLARKHPWVYDEPSEGWHGDSRCYFCGNRGTLNQHAADCLWQMARTLTAEQKGDQ